MVPSASTVTTLSSLVEKITVLPLIALPAASTTVAVSLRDRPWGMAGWFGTSTMSEGTRGPPSSELLEQASVSAATMNAVARQRGIILDSEAVQPGMGIAVEPYLMKSTQPASLGTTIVVWPGSMAGRRGVPPTAMVAMG